MTQNNSSYPCGEDTGSHRAVSGSKDVRPGTTRDEAAPKETHHQPEGERNRSRRFTWFPGDLVILNSGES